MTGALGFVAWRSRKAGKVKGLDGGLDAVTSRPGKSSMNMRSAGVEEVAGSAIASQHSVMHGLLNRPERRQVRKRCERGTRLSG